MRLQHCIQCQKERECYVNNGNTSKGQRSQTKRTLKLEKFQTKLVMIVFADNTKKKTDIDDYIGI